MFVALEGIDCVGKSTQIELLKKEFSEAIFSFEPGNSDLGRALREILLNQKNKICKKAELLLFLADRAQTYEEILSKNKENLIISDRSAISGLAYAQEFDLNLLFELNSFVLDGFFPQKVVFLKADESLIKERLARKNLDAIESRGVDYFLKIQEQIEKILSFLKTKINIEILTLNAAFKREILKQKIKDFIND